MRKGVNSGRPRANFPRKILKENYYNNPVYAFTFLLDVLYQKKLYVFKARCNVNVCRRSLFLVSMLRRLTAVEV